MLSETSQITFKIVLLGDSGVGKTSVVTRYVESEWSEAIQPTVTIDSLTHDLTHAGVNYRMHIWDTAGQERFRSVAPFCVRGASGAILVFDVSSLASFASVREQWLSLVREHNPGDSCFVVVFGNKTDLERNVSISDCMAFCETHNLRYCEGSAKTGHGVPEVFQMLIEGSRPKKLISEPVALSAPTTRQCC
jgi:small GTP-binding protein